MAKKDKSNSKAFAQQKRHRRKWLAFMRMCRYGVNNFSRNAWLTIAATAVMTITLLIVLTTFVARNVLIDTVDDIRSRVDMSIYVQTDISEDDVNQIRQDLAKLGSVSAVAYVSPSDARQLFANENKGDQDTLAALTEATNRFPGTFRVNLKDINDTSELDTFVKDNDVYLANQDSSNKPSFAGERRSAIQNIGRWVGFAERAGLVASFVFVAISSLIVFNTIRMAIFNRREEIQMMRLIGAEKAFIRGPFIVEAVVYGVIAAILATVLGLVGLYSIKDKLQSYEVAITPTIDMMTTYIPFVVIAMIILGALIGAISSLLATRRYLKM